MTRSPSRSRLRVAATALAVLGLVALALGRFSRDRRAEDVPAAIASEADSPAETATPPVVAMAPHSVEAAPPVDPTGASAHATVAPDRELLRSGVAGFLAQHMPGRELSSGQLESLVDTMLRARDLHAEISAREGAPDGDSRLAELRAEVERAGADLREILGVDADAVEGLFHARTGRTAAVNP